jgi:hypothetical protein
MENFVATKISDELMEIIFRDSYWFGEINVREFLRTHGDTKEYINTFGEINKMTPLRAALYEPTCPEIVLLLIQSGSDVNIKDRRGESVLWWSMFKISRYLRHRILINLKLFEYLIDHGADITMRNNWQQTILMYTRYRLKIYFFKITC